MYVQAMCTYTLIIGACVCVCGRIMGRLLEEHNFKAQVWPHRGLIIAAIEQDVERGLGGDGDIESQIQYLLDCEQLLSKLSPPMLHVCTCMHAARHPGTQAPRHPGTQAYTPANFKLESVSKTGKAAKYNARRCSFRGRTQLFGQASDNVAQQLCLSRLSKPSLPSLPSSPSLPPSPPSPLCPPLFL